MSKLYFIGIGGIGMSALARFYKDRGYEIHGYDKVKTVLTRKLEDEGMIIHYTDDIGLIPKDIDEVIITPAIPEDHKELVWLRDNGYHVTKRAEKLGKLSKEMYSICIAGTHGKTTTSHILSHILTYAESGATSILGGIPVDTESNYVSGKGEVLVTEADEFDRSFLHLYPDIATIMSLDPDHLDIYGGFEKMKDSFTDFGSKVSEGGAILIRYDVPELLGGERMMKWKDREVEIMTFGSTDAHIGFENARVEKGRSVFDYVESDGRLDGVSLVLPGIHNIENCIVAISIARMMGCGGETIREAVADFKGIKRRFEVKLTGDLVVIDDYAHHPTELRAAISAARMMYPGKKITGVFQPHLFSRTQDFAGEFAAELDKLDEVILMPIYPAREKPIEGVNSEMLASMMTNERVEIWSRTELKNKIENIDTDILLFLGAGDIDEELPELIRIIEKKID